MRLKTLDHDLSEHAAGLVAALELEKQGSNYCANLFIANESNDVFQAVVLVLQYQNYRVYPFTENSYQDPSP
jgi:hypothetical protein